MTTQQRQLAKWCAYALAIAAPGSLIVLPLWLLRRHWASRNAWLARLPRRASAQVSESDSGKARKTRAPKHSESEVK